ncbi:hypothetical protein ROHU_021556 [Labeo rohita]|uniref:Endonuclease/exonuclease/phosphatase domain-containing protein n=1 Tax=Labeo rohita TaxID=84645 RepID=A0A498N8R9_LABRO|nr:hypothetical protein ROHU_021556 [Labeo rohita]
MGSSIGEESSHAVSEVDIISAVNSLQVSDTPRPDGIPVSFYKENIKDLIPYIKMLNDKIHSGAFNCSEIHFNETVKSPQDDNQHFFNVDYLIIATIQAKRLNDLLESQSKACVTKNSAIVMITPKTFCTEMRLSCIKDEIEKQKQSNPNLYQDFLIVKNLLRDAPEVDTGSVDVSIERNKLLDQGCPLTPVLITLALKCFVSELAGHLKQHDILVFKESVILCIQPEDLGEVIAAVKNRASDVFYIKELSSGNINCEQLKCIGNEFKDEDWDEMDAEIFVYNTEEESQASWSSRAYEEHDFVIHKEEDITVEGDGRQTMYAVVTLQESDEVMVVASNWMSPDKKQCYWPPFKSTEKCTEAVQNRIKPETGGKQWEKLNIIFHRENVTFEKAKEGQKEIKEQKEQQTMYAVVTLQESDEVMVVASNWLSPDKKQCYWPPFRSTEKCTEAVQNRIKPETGGKPWEKLNINLHWENVTFEKAKEGQKQIKEQKKQESLVCERDLSMDTQTINFLTWNVNGLKHRDQKFQELQNAHIVFFQETHIGIGDENIIDSYKDEWYIFYTKYTSSSKGTAILVRKTLDFEHISDEKDHCGAYVVLKCKLNGQLYTLVSVYNHQTDTKTLDKLSRYLQSMTTGLLVIGGDFNTVLNRFTDKKWSKITNRTHSKLLLFVEKFMKSLQLVDVWRRKNPIKQDYTYYIKDSPVSRLDYFFVPEECMWRVRSCEIRDLKMVRDVYYKDHQPVSLEINNITPFQKDPQIQVIFQWLNLKKDLLPDEMGLLVGEESSHAVSEVDIVSAVNSLQVSDTPRPDGIPATSYKDQIQDLIPYIKMLYDRIHRGAFNCSEKHFNETVKCPHDDSQHFFNVDFLIIATILARRLEDVMETLPKGRIPKDSATVMITPKTHYALISLSCIKNELQQQKRSNPTLSQDLLIIENLLSDASKDFSDEKYKVLHQGCPLTPGLLMLALKSYATQLFGHLENFGVFIFKQSVIVCFQSDDLEIVKATVESSTNEVYEIEILSGGNGELLQLTCLGKDEDWDEWITEAFGNNEAESEENDFKADERDDESKMCEETDHAKILENEHQSVAVDGRSDIFSETPVEKMDAFHGMKKNHPPLLPVPLQPGTSSDEIPKLQDVLRSINKSINRELTRDYVSEAKGVLSLIQSVQLDTDKKAAETKVAIRMDLENNLKKALIEMDTYFDSIYNDLEKCLSKGVEESVQKCVASAKALVAPEAKLKASLIRDTVELKKDIYSSIIKTIQNKMAPCYEKAAALTGIGSMKERQDMLVNTVDEKKQDMFNKAKMEVLNKLKQLKLNIKDVLEPGLKKAMDLSLSQSSNTTLMDVSREIDQMEALLKQLSD